MAAARTIAALLVVMAVVAVTDAGKLPDRAKFRRWFHECRKEAGISKSKPLWAAKKSIAGIYDPNSHHAFRKTKLTVVKYEFATVRDPSQAEKCLMQCLAEKQGMINGSRLDATTINNVMTALGQKINLMSSHKRVNMTKLKRNTAKCIAGTHGSTENCELGYQLMHCLRRALIESLYDESLSTAAPSTWAPTTPASAPQPPPPMESTERMREYPPPPPPPQRFMAGPPPPPMPMPMAPPPMPMMPVASPAGMTPALVAYRQGSGMVQVYRRESAPWPKPWRRMHEGHRMHPMI